MPRSTSARSAAASPPPERPAAVAARLSAPTRAGTGAASAGPQLAGLSARSADVFPAPGGSAARASAPRHRVGSSDRPTPAASRSSPGASSAGCPAAPRSGAAGGFISSGARSDLPDVPPRVPSDGPSAGSRRFGGRPAPTSSRPRASSAGSAAGSRGDRGRRFRSTAVSGPPDPLRSPRAGSPRRVPGPSGSRSPVAPRARPGALGVGSPPSQPGGGCAAAACGCSGSPESRRAPGAAEPSLPGRPS
jgi:hypothetical protein